MNKVDHPLPCRKMKSAKEAWARAMNKQREWSAEIECAEWANRGGSMEERLAQIESAVKYKKPSILCRLKGLAGPDLIRRSVIDSNIHKRPHPSKRHLCDTSCGDTDLSTIYYMGPLSYVNGHSGRSLVKKTTFFRPGGAHRGEMPDWARQVQGLGRLNHAARGRPAGQKIRQEDCPA